MNTLKPHLKFIHATSSKTCVYLNRKTLNSIDTLCFGLLERLRFTSGSLEVLIEQMNLDLTHEFSIGILVRALLLDTLIGMNLQRIVAECKKMNRTDAETKLIVEGYAETILSDGLKHTFNYIEDAKKMGFIDEKNRDISIYNLANSHKKFIEGSIIKGEQPKLKYEKFYSPIMLFKLLASTNNMREVAKLYDTYLYFSKYDHFGILYFQVIRQKLSTKVEAYTNAVEAFAVNQMVIHDILANNNNEDRFLHDQSMTSSLYVKNEVIKI